MNKIIELFLLASCVTIFASGCSKSPESLALEIYNDSNLSKKEKIDRLYALYVGSYKSNSSYNKAAADRAWEAILNGNYEKAANITSTYKSDEYNYYAIYYAKKLQVAAPAPDSVFVNIKISNYGGGWQKLIIDMPQLDDNFPIDGIIKNEYLGSIEQKSLSDSLFSTFDTGDNQSPSTRLIEGNIVKFKIKITPYLGWDFSYYDKSGIYEYSCTFNIDSSPNGGNFACDYIGTATSIY